MSNSELLARVATLYYEEGLAQKEIARQVGVSRSSISRLLSQARSEGIVEIKVHRALATLPELERELARRFRLKAAHVLAAGGQRYEEMLRDLGRLASRCLDDRLFDGAVLAISWGTAIYETARAMRRNRRRSALVVQMIGALGHGDPLVDGPQLAWMLASACGGQYKYLQAPLVVESEEVGRALLREPNISEALNLARHADLALVGIGTPVAELSCWLRAGYLDEAQLAELRAQGVVGDVCARMYDICGCPVDVAFARRMVGIDLESLRRDIKLVLGVSGGLVKARSILGALRGRYIDVLVTDDQAALEVLRLDEEGEGRC